MKQGAISRAERKFIRALEFDPANPEYHFELANVYATRYDAWKELPGHPKTQEWLRKTAKALEQAAMIRPDFVAAHFNLGVVYKKLGRYERSREQFKKVLLVDPKNAAAHMQIAATYEEQGFFDEAKDSYLKAKEFDYFNPAIQSSLENVDEMKEEDRLRQNERAMRSRQMRMLGYFKHTPGSLADQHQNERMLAGQSGQNAAIAIPYLAQMLVKQFMNRRAINRIEEP